MLGNKFDGFGAPNTRRDSSPLCFNPINDNSRGICTNGITSRICIGCTGKSGNHRKKSIKRECSSEQVDGKVSLFSIMVIKSLKSLVILFFAI